MPGKSRKHLVREPVQVYLYPSDRGILEWTAILTGLPRAEVLRRGLRSIAAELLVEQSPALAFLDAAQKVAVPTELSDVALNHDAYLGASEIAA